MSADLIRDAIAAAENEARALKVALDERDQARAELATALREKGEAEAELSAVKKSAEAWHRDWQAEVASHKAAIAERDAARALNADHVRTIEKLTAELRAQDSAAAAEIRKLLPDVAAAKQRHDAEVARLLAEAQRLREELAEEKRAAVRNYSELCVKANAALARERRLREALEGALEVLFDRKSSPFLRAKNIIDAALAPTAEQPKCDCTAATDEYHCKGCPADDGKPIQPATAAADKPSEHVHDHDGPCLEADCDDAEPAPATDGGKVERRECLMWQVARTVPEHIEKYGLWATVTLASRGTAEAWRQERKRPDDFVVCCIKETITREVLATDGGRPGFENELKQLINSYSMENGSDTPDFILASLVTKHLAIFGEIVRNREAWYGRATSEVLATDGGTK